MVALVEQLALPVNGRPIRCVEGEWEASSSQKKQPRRGVGRYSVEMLEVALNGG